MKDMRPRPVAVAIPVRLRGDELEILMQRRCNSDDDTPYTGYWEFPQGKIEASESVTEAAARELREETTLTLGHVVVGKEQAIPTPGLPSSITSVAPLLCVLDTQQRHLGLAIVATVRGTAQSTEAARDHTWMNAAEAVKLADHQEVFPLDLAFIRQIFMLEAAVIEALQQLEG